MAAAVGGGDGGGGKKGRKSRGTPHIDMTPMVDLGFLLLTFFVLTTSMSTPSTMPVIFPADPPPGAPPPPKVPEGKILNLLVSGNDKLYWYKGLEDVELNNVGYGENGLRKLVLDMQKKVKSEFPNDKDENPLIVLVKSNYDSRYKNMVDIVDEMNITEQGKYMLIEMEPEEIALISDFEKEMSEESSIKKSLEKVDISNLK